ncbi:MobA/MobL family protein [Thalassospira xiamenensis]|uniref:MobA/MobL family protein n=1 Tax=Thalassospira xiamenensis TaxID=220697 RepID=UPI000DEDD61D|nr:MobA/MobL family protein [Thalassospira xiamenensis]RCK37291.1 hypothetical protein TH24_17125 [Thalassospira xiamenensis]
MRIFFDDLLDGGEDTRPKMGRVSMAEEALIKRLLRSDPLWDFKRFAASRRNPVVPALKTSRPTSAAGGQTFVFSLKGWQSAGSSQRFCVGQAAAAKQAGLSYHAKIRHPGGIGAFRFEGPVAAGMREVSTFNGARLRVGGASAFQGYIERDEAVEYSAGQESSVGNIHDETEFRRMFWDAVERREGAGKRIQHRLIAELPFEDAIGPDGRRDILIELGTVLDDLGLPWHGVVHLPEKQSDPRNYHLHLLFHDRPLLGWDSWDQPIFARLKNQKVRNQNFIKELRSTYADIVNRAFLTAGVKRMWDPRTYQEMGIDKPPQQHLGSAVVGLERRGIVTGRGKQAAEAEMAWRYRELEIERIRKRLAVAERLAKRIITVRDNDSKGSTTAIRSAQAQYLEKVTRATGQYITVLDWRHQQKWLQERHRVLRSRLELLLEDPECGASAKRYTRKLDRFYGRLFGNIDIAARSAETRLQKDRKQVETALRNWLVETHLDRLVRANGAIERAVAEMSWKKSREAKADQEYDKLLERQRALLKQRVTLRKRLPEGFGWDEIERDVDQGPKSWTRSEISWKEASETVLGLRNVGRKLERLIRNSTEPDNADVENPLIPARREKLKVLRAIREAGLSADVSERIGGMAHRKTGFKRNSQA